MPANNRWPDSYGFSIYGHGPCYVTYVERASVAHHAGLMPGDQILQLDGHDATNMSSEYVKKLAKHSRTVPPALGVASRVQYVELIASRRFGYGLSLHGSNSKAVLIENVEIGSPAFKAGLRRGDIVLEANGRRIRAPDVVQPLLDLRKGKLTLAIVAVEKKNASMDDKYRSPGSRVRKARELFAKMNTVLGNDYEKKMAVVGVLKQYAEDRQVEKFSRALSVLLPTSHHRRLVPEIRPFVPVRHRSRFDSLLEHNPLEPVYLPSGSSDLSTAMPPSTATNDSLVTPQDVKRTVTVKRDLEGGFGFILRGHNPVYVESIDPGGPADQAGLIPGDAFLHLNGLDVKHCSHGHLVKLLQGSGLSPTLEVIHSTDEDGIPIRQDFSFGSSSSQSSHASSGWLSETTSIKDQEGKSFKEKVEYLFTSKEKSSLKKALHRYNNNKNIDRLVGELSVLLDTPSKQTLWVFILPLLPMEHQERCLEHINVPHHVIEDVIPNELRETLASARNGQAPSSTDMTSGDETETSDFRFSFTDDSQPEASTSGMTQSMNHKNNLASFKHQLEFLLTSRERSQLKKALQIYAEKRNIHYLVEDVMVILDTPSKRSLWLYILPLLSKKHQQYCKNKFNITNPDGSRSTSTNGYYPPVNTSYIGDVTLTSATPRKGDVTYYTDEEYDYGENGILLRPGSATTETTEKNSTDTEIDSDQLWHGHYGKYPPPVRGSYEVNRADESKRSTYGSKKGGPFKRSKHYTDSDMSNGTGDQSDVSMNPIYESHLVNTDSHPIVVVRVVKETSVQTSPVHQQRPVMGIKVLPSGMNSSSNHYETVEFRGQNGYSSQNGGSHHHESSHHHGNSNNHGGRNHHGHTNQNGDSGHHGYSHHYDVSHHHGNSNHYAQHDTSGHQGHNGHLDPHVGGLVSDYERRRFDSESEDSSIHSSPSLQTSRTHESSSSAAFRHQAMSIKSSESFNIKARKAIRALDDVVANEITDVDSVVVRSATPSSRAGRSAAKPVVPPAPPPPPPPPPPPAPPPLPKAIDITDSTLMQVKRINWEKLDVSREGLKNTVWGQCADSHDYLNDVVKYLELEQQFSLKKKSKGSSFHEKKKEVTILAPKKAYNISILLAHLKMSTPEIKDALFSIDEDFLTPQLLSQMKAYAPDAQEMEKYDAYDGKLEELSKADQFAYQLSRVSGYEQRLKALLFKANFAEKVEEVRENLKCLRKASQEIKHSKKLARVLELVLAMGNHLNKGHSRIGQATAFKISFLSHLHTTKTADNKSTFLHVLAWAVYTKMPDVLSIRQELVTVPEAAKLTNDDITRELNDLRKVLQEISATISKVGGQTKQRLAVNDRFQDVMGHFISTASDELQGLFSLQALALEEFNSMVQYFGEDSKSASTNDIFGIFADFITRFEQAHHQNMMQRRI